MKFFSLNQFMIAKDEFFKDVFVLSPYFGKEKDTIIICNPRDVMIISPVLPRSSKSLEEHIEYINENNIKKAIVAADDISFLLRCPGLEYLYVIPSIYAENFDYSPLYEMKNLKWLQCDTVYGLGLMCEGEKKKVATIDYSRIPGIKRLTVLGPKGNLNVDKADSVKILYLSEFPKADTLTGSFPTQSLECLNIIQSPIRSLKGIEDARKLRRLQLNYNRRLADISDLRYLRENLICLEIEACGRIRDFSVLSELQNLEFLTLKGSQTLPNLSFLKDLPNLKYLRFDMNVEDGDMSWCENITYVQIQNHKHYSHKNDDLPKGDCPSPDNVCPFDIV